jgi:phosphodiesterase/alkaline phosphatase D-like protein
MMIDDHEIEDNWEPLPGKRKLDRKMVKGRRSYLRYQRIAGPDQIQVPPRSDSANPLWYKLDMNGFPVFMADTRTEREPRTIQNFEAARIMSFTQFDALLDWLEQHRSDQCPKFIASSVALLPRHREAICSDAGALRSDSWDGYPRSLYCLLAYIADNEMRDVFFLSGDEHISFVTRAVVENKTSHKTGTIYAIHNSPLYAPFPFANATTDNLALKESFDFPGDRKDYKCDVSTPFSTTGDGFSLLRASCKPGGWEVIYQFVCGRTGTPGPPIKLP